MSARVLGVNVITGGAAVARPACFGAAAPARASTAEKPAGWKATARDLAWVLPPGANPSGETSDCAAGFAPLGASARAAATTAAATVPSRAVRIATCRTDQLLIPTAPC